MQTTEVRCWSGSLASVHVLKADYQLFCPKGHKLTSNVAPVTQVPAFCNFCFKHVVQSSWAGDVKYCPVNTCCFTICASCQTSLAANPEIHNKFHSSLQQNTVSSLQVRLNISAEFCVAVNMIFFLKFSWVLPGSSNFVASLVKKTVGQSLSPLDHRRCG